METYCRTILKAFGDKHLNLYGFKGFKHDIIQMDFKDKRRPNQNVDASSASAGNDHVHL